GPAPRRREHQGGRGHRACAARGARHSRRTRVMRKNRAGILTAVIALLAITVAPGCRNRSANGPIRASGYIEATEVRLAPEVGGRVVELKVAEGDRVNVGDLIARLDTADTELSIRRAEAERDQAVAQLRLLQAGSRQEDIRQA